MNANGFLDALFGGEGCAHLWSYLWCLTLPRNRNPDGTWPKRTSESIWFPTSEIDAMAAKVSSCRDIADVYFGVGLAPRKGSSTERCRAADVAGIVGLWLDIDYGSDGHQTKNRPPTIEGAYAIVNALGMKPSLIVRSGHGLQPWWLFKEPWLFDTPAERMKGANLVKCWSDLAKRKAKAHGWDVDSVCDLSRVLRVPETLNHKDGLTNPGTPPIAVTVEADEPLLRYDPSNFDDFFQQDAHEFVAMSANVARAPTVTVGPVLVDPARQPGVKWGELLTTSKKFRDTWNHASANQKDTSPSGWDMSLAIAGVKAGWADQEIADVLVAHRVKHGAEIKRDDYFRRTIESARKVACQNDLSPAQLENIEAIIKELELVDKQDADRNKAARSSLCKIVSDLIGVNVMRVLRLKAPTPIFKIMFDCGLVTFDSIRNISNQESFRNKVGEHLMVWLNERKTGWKFVVKAILAAAEDQLMGELGTAKDTAWAWMTEYLDECPDPNTDNASEACLVTNNPFIYKGRRAVFLSHFRDWVHNRRGEKSITSKCLASALRECGCESVIMNCTLNRRPTTRSIWLIPDQVANDGDSDGGGGGGVGRASGGGGGGGDETGDNGGNILSMMGNVPAAEAATAARAE